MPATESTTVVAVNDRSLAVAMLLVVLGTSWALLFASYDPGLAGMLDDCALQESVATKRVFDDRGYFPNCSQRMIYEDLPAIDCSHGGVYVLGTSNLVWGTNLRHRDPDVKRLVHNCGVAASTHDQQRQLVAHLVKRPGFLAAGPEKTLFLLAISYHSVGHPDPAYFPACWTAYGQYNYDTRDGISFASPNPLELEYSLARARVAGLLQSVRECAARHLKGLVREPSIREHSAETYNRLREKFMQDDWRDRLSAQMAELDGLFRELRQLRVNVAVVLMPQGSWEEKVPFERTYTLAISDLCHADDVPLHDFSSLLEDDDFADSNHLNPSGVDKLTGALLEISVPFLKGAAALPAG